MRSTTLFIAACWLLTASPAGAAGLEPRAGAAPAGLGGLPVLPPVRAAACSRARWRRAPPSGRSRSAPSAPEGERFFAQSCSGCHVTACGDCHGAAPHAGAPLKNDACTRCHRGYFVGWDY